MRHVMYTLIVKGARNSTLAYHHCDSNAELKELLAVYRALGYEDKSLLIEKREAKAA
jgi:hypothetical protein